MGIWRDQVFNSLDGEDTHAALYEVSEGGTLSEMNSDALAAARESHLISVSNIDKEFKERGSVWPGLRLST